MDPLLPLPPVLHHGAVDAAAAWQARFRGQAPVYLCVLGFTQTALVPGISAAGATPADREYTAVADAEFLYDGPTATPTYPLPPLAAGVSPALIARAVLAAQQIPIYLFNAGLPHAPSVPHIDLGGAIARCVSTGAALPLPVVEHLFAAGLDWGKQLGQRFAGRYLIVSECVVGGTTTAQAVLTALGWAAAGKVNSSHPHCNHAQKQVLVEAGLQHWQPDQQNPLAAVAAVGDPMQPVVAGLALAASQRAGVLLAGGSQMIAVYGLLRAVAKARQLDWQPHRVAVGTTRWVLEDPTSQTLALASSMTGLPLLSSRLSFAAARYPQLQRYEQGFVKEGVGAGGCAIAAHLYNDWSVGDLVTHVEALVEALRKPQ